jgi:hypothetical protein
MRNTLLTMMLAGVSTLATAAMPGSMMTANYFPLTDGTRYEYVFVNGPHTTGTAVMHAGQTWAGVGGLMGVHLSLVCRDAVPCTMDMNDFYQMDADGVHWFGGSSQAPDGSHYMMSLANPDWVLKNPVSPGTTMGPGMGYQNSEQWQMPVIGMNTMMGRVGYTSMYQAMALETVVTPAGVFANSLHVRERRGDGTERDVWYAPDVGVVRWMDGTEEALLKSMTRPTGPVPQVALAVEYYHAAFDHYFMTADATEIDALDRGVMSGWQRTGMGFNVIVAEDTASPMASTVCRFYGRPEYGLDTHFYTASTDECATVQRNWPQQWQLESANVFRVYMPDTMSGSCTDGTVPIYRAWNQRVDSNHRFTIDPAVQAQMMNHGNVAEGYGNTPVAMCSPQ